MNWKSIASGVGLALLTGCAGTVNVPDAAELDDPRPVFLLDHGHHSSLVVTRADDSMVRYVYGDWRWYAMRETGFLRSFPTLFASTQAALGRRELDGPPEADSLRGRIRVVIDQLYGLSAPAERIDSLIERLDQRFDAAADTRMYNQDYDLEFVHDPKPYTLGSNSNHVIAAWLEELGIDVSGNPMFGRWRVEDAQ